MVFWIFSVKKFLSNMSELISSIMERRTLYPLVLVSCISMTHCFAGSIGGRVYALNLFDSLKIQLNRNWITVIECINAVQR